jgi:hypothetical protein
MELREIMEGELMRLELRVLEERCRVTVRNGARIELVDDLGRPSSRLAVDCG